MAKLDKMYALAEQNNIEVLPFSLPVNKTISIYDVAQDLSFIGIDYHKIKGEREELIRLAHELGHCMSGAFYNRFSALDLKARHERRAWVWAICELVPEDALHSAVSAGHTELWELAEYFNLPQWLVEKAVCYYEGIE